jgi:predicted ATPase
MQLMLLEERTLEQKRPQLVSIVAPAGTGKTRLLEEFLKRLDPDDGFQVAMVRCLPYGQTLTYWPLRGLLDGLLPGEPIVKPTIERIFMAGGYKEDDASHLADLILSTLGIEGEGTSGAGDRESIFTAWRLLIEVFSKQAPRVLIFEDLHWASDSMLDLVEHIISVRTQARLLLIVLSRPELLDRRPAWGGGRQNFTALALQPLSTKQTQELIDKLSAELPDAVRQQIVDRSGGNPFFALELVRGVMERDQADGSSSLDALPDTVHEAVQARLDMLSKQERAMLQVASVASRSIRVPMLRAVLDNTDEQQIDAAIDGLVARDMLLSLDVDTYTFRHILIRDVAYNTLSRAERIRLHSKIAAWLEGAAADHLDEYAELIAYHYQEAVKLAGQSAVPKPMVAETAKAMHYLERAGELAARAGAFAEARDYLRNALSLAPASAQLRLNEKLGDALVWGDTVVNAYSAALERWKAEARRA